jgi:pimeloyl-ACP methyl ester carboxylesterase
VSGKATPIGPAYSVILTFDYENLDTSIEENAASLAHGLKAIGLAAGHGKRFDIVAHSMGGLISRHMIEFVGGVEVSRLITLGTPNGGSPWPTVQKWATVGVAFAVNSLTAVVWPVQVLGTLLAAIEKVDTALDEMESTSVFLGQLARGPDPGVPYHVIVGDRSLVAGANAEGLLARLSPRRIASDLVDVAFFNQPNDLAVSVASAQSIPTGRKPAAQFYVLASDHVSFFVREASLAEMAEILLD